MKRLSLLIILIGLSKLIFAQFNFSFTDARIPVTGSQFGLIYGESSSFLMNRDDLNAEFIRQKTYTRYSNYGIEHIRWFTPYFGFGQQFQIWCSGATYKNTSLSGVTTDAETSLLYLKIPALFWWKSYSRWNPDRRLRANTFFGPYIGILSTGSEYWDESTSYSLNTDDEENLDNNSPYKSIDYGFVMGAGIEIRLWTKYVLALNLRSDIGMKDMENKDYEVLNPNTGERYEYYNSIPSKFSAPPGVGSQSQDFNRPETTNFSYGLQVSLRKYFGAK